MHRQKKHADKPQAYMQTNHKPGFFSGALCQTRLAEAAVQDPNVTKFDIQKNYALPLCIFSRWSG